jgi:hypothetical protein
VLGQSSITRLNSGSKKLTWNFEEEVLSKMNQFAIVADINAEDHVVGMVVQETVYEGSTLWQLRWERFRERLWLK